MAKGKSWTMWAAWGPLTVAILLVMSGSIVVGAPTCGRYEYLENGQCFPCPTCSPGYGVSGPCGFGQGALTTCAPCDPNPADPLIWPTFSDSTSQERCQPCKLCDNSHYSVNCSATTNSQCGLCHFGFYRTHPDEENCLPCKYVIPSYTYLCQDWLDAQKTTIPTNTGPPMDVSTEPVTTTKNTLVATPDRDALALSSETDSSGYDPIVIIMTTIAVLIGLGVFTFIAVQCHKRGSLPCHKGTNFIPGPSVSTVDSGGSEDGAEDKDRHDADDPEAEQLDNKLINLEEIQTEEGEETDALLSRTEKPNGITPGPSGIDKDDDRDGSEDDTQKSGSSSTASSTSSLDTENGDEAATAPKGQGDANDCSDPSSGTELLKGERRPKSPKKRASYGSYGSQKSRLSSQLSPSSSSSEGSINGTVEALPCKQNNATPYRAASPAVACHPTHVKWSAPGGTAEGETLLSNSHHQNAVGWMDVHKGSRPVVELDDGRLVNQTARLPSDHESSTEAKMEMTDEIRNLFNRACDKCGDHGVKELSQDARDELANHLNPQPNREGVHSNWVHLADRFKVEGAKRDNLQEMKNLLQLLQTKNNCTIRELLQNVASIERFDALEAVCRVLLQDSKNSLQDTSV